MAKKRKKKLKFIIIFIMLLVFTQCFSIKQILKAKQEKETLKNNRVVLEGLEKVEVVDIEKNTPKEAKVSTESNKVYFENSVFMGDSQTEPLEVYNILNKSSVLAKKGQDVIKAKNTVSVLAEVKPKRIFLLYGMNDLDLFNNASDFKKNYIKFIEEIKKNMPSSEIYIQSIMPVQPKAQERNKNYSQDRVDKFSQVVKEVAEEEKVNYIDITPIVKDRDDLYEQDGMHFNIKFYNLWLEYLRKQLEK